MKQIVVKFPDEDKDNENIKKILAPAGKFNNGMSLPHCNYPNNGYDLQNCSIYYYISKKDSVGHFGVLKKVVLYES